MTSPTGVNGGLQDTACLPAGERMSAKLLRDQIRERHHQERDDIPHHLIDPVREVPARVLRARLAPIAMAVSVPIVARVTIWSRPRRLDITIDYSWVTDPRRAEKMVASYHFAATP